MTQDSFWNNLLTGDWNNLLAGTPVTIPPFDMSCWDDVESIQAWGDLEALVIDPPEELDVDPNDHTYEPIEFNSTSSLVEQFHAIEPLEEPPLAEEEPPLAEGEDPSTPDMNAAPPPREENP